ncbi:hypothetical protein [Streptomyces sp. MA15]|uniref:hypothetical protein n=1 Tax=Streptomyces sp. MA15 TaxID=3055061 RepID=UPI0025B2072E|nr:hypothetical protein [Streptomyces sp. MA15]MDN3272402.1 hypothetical protein [Streptomyces sp. MA15]
MKAEVRPHAFVNHDITAGRRRDRDGGVAGAARELRSEAVDAGPVRTAKTTPKAATVQTLRGFTLIPLNRHDGRAVGKGDHIVTPIAHGMFV